MQLYEVDTIMNLCRTANQSDITACVDNCHCRWIQTSHLCAGPSLRHWCWSGSTAGFSCRSDARVHPWCWATQRQAASDCKHMLTCATLAGSFVVRRICRMHGTRHYSVACIRLRMKQQRQSARIFVHFCKSTFFESFAHAVFFLQISSLSTI